MGKNRTTVRILFGSCSIYNKNIIVNRDADTLGRSEARRTAHGGDRAETIPQKAIFLDISDFFVSVDIYYLFAVFAENAHRRRYFWICATFRFLRSVSCAVSCAVS